MQKALSVHLLNSKRLVTVNRQTRSQSLSLE